MAEELIRSVLWFHPAVWFVLSRVQLAREQVVDREVVHATRDRAGYLDALVSVAAQRLQPDVAPAPLFLKKRQLAVRVQALLKETSMSASRLAAHVSAAASVAIIGACAAVWFFPLRSAAQVVPDDPGITVDAGAALAHRSPVHNPQRRDRRGRRAAGAHAQFQRRGRRCARAERSGRIAQGGTGERARVALRGGYGSAFAGARDDSLRTTICCSNCGCRSSAATPTSSATSATARWSSGWAWRQRRHLATLPHRRLHRLRHHPIRQWCSGSSFGD